jgi:hypothetical protein
MEETAMRVFAVATILFLSSSLVPTFAQDEGKSPATSPQTVPVQPERSPQQSPEQDRNRGEDRQVGRDWRAQERDGDRMDRMGQNDVRRMRDSMRSDMDWDHRTVGSKQSLPICWTANVITLVRVIGFNVAEGWSRDVSQDVAHELRQRCADQRRESKTPSRPHGSRQGRAMVTRDNGH